MKTLAIPYWQAWLLWCVSGLPLQLTLLSRSMSVWVALHLYGSQYTPLSWRLSPEIENSSWKFLCWLTFDSKTWSLKGRMVYKILRGNCSSNPVTFCDHMQHHRNIYKVGQYLLPVLILWQNWQQQFLERMVDAYCSNHERLWWADVSSCHLYSRYDNQQL